VVSNLFNLSALLLLLAVSGVSGGSLKGYVPLSDVCSLNEVHFDSAFNGYWIYDICNSKPVSNILYF